MSTVAEVRLWGTRIGAVALEDGNSIASFQYAPEFLASGIELSPLVMPLRPAPYTFAGLATETFHGLPGLLADSLPDRYGHALIDAWLAAQGRSPASFNAVERLCYVGLRGMGALEFHPVRGPRAARGHEIQVSALVELASEVLSDRAALVASLASGRRGQAMRDILAVGTSAGGARAKAVIAWNPRTNTIRSGQLDPGPGFEHWLLKLDGVRANRDHDTLADPQGYGAVEYAYALMAHTAKIEISECRLLTENGRHHFMTRRFDRGADGAKRHMQSLGALAHFDFNQPGAHSYEQVFLIIRQLGMPQRRVEQMFRRMVFNVLARNQDDHVKNVAFLMDRGGRWDLAPAFDLTYAFRPESAWTGKHQLTMAGKREAFTREDVERAGRTALLPAGRALRILDEVREVLAEWPSFAERAGVSDDHLRRITPTLLLSLPAS